MKLVFGKIVLTAGLAALLITGCATPQDKQAQADQDALCAALDTDKDGKVTKEEFLTQASDKAKAAEIFDKCDSNKKGYLTYNEVWNNRVMLPPEISMMTPPRLRGIR